MGERQNLLQRKLLHDLKVAKLFSAGGKCISFQQQPLYQVSTAYSSDCITFNCIQFCLREIYELKCKTSRLPVLWEQSKCRKKYIVAHATVKYYVAGKRYFNRCI